MYLCVCKAISTKDVDEAVKSCGSCPEQIITASGAGTCCGSCKTKLEEYVRESSKVQAVPKRTGT